MKKLINLVLLMMLLTAGCQREAVVANLPSSTSTATRTVPARLTDTQTPSPQPSRTNTVQPTVISSATVTSSPTAIPTTPVPSATIDPSLVYVNAGQVNVPILMYHRVRNDGSTRYILRVEEFRAQMDALHEAGFETVTISTLADVIRGGGHMPAKPIAITFDDGFLDIYENAFPILNELDYQATAYIITSTLDSELSYGYMQKAELQALVEAGWEIGSHSISHTDLKSTKLGIRNELEKSKRDLEDLLGIEVRSFSYPYSITNDWIMERVAEYGYDSAVGVGLETNHTTKGLYFISRLDVYRGMPLTAFKKMIQPKEPAALEPEAQEPAANEAGTPTPVN